MSRHSSITQDWMGWNAGLFPRACHHPCSGTSGYHFPPIDFPLHTQPEKSRIWLCYLITSMRSQLLPMVHFSRDSGNFCVQVIGMQSEMNRKRHLPIQTQMTRDTRHMTNTHSKNGPLKGLCESILRSWQMSSVKTKDEHVCNSSSFILWIVKQASQREAMFTNPFWCEFMPFNSKINTLDGDLSTECKTTWRLGKSFPALWPDRWGLKS